MQKKIVYHLFFVSLGFISPLHQKWHNFCICNDMDIQKINRRHFVETDMYYRISLGLSSKLLKFENGIFHIEVTLHKKWSKNYNATAAEIAHCWKVSNPELSKAIGCKVYIIDHKVSFYKEFLIASGIHAGYDALKGVIFRKNYLN